MMWWNGGGGSHWLAMSLMMGVFVGLVIAFSFWLVRASRGESGADGGGRPATSADDVLAERFARGEIDQDEFTRDREVLHANDRS
jgi:putative membrane protein